MKFTSKFSSVTLVVQKCNLSFILAFYSQSNLLSHAAMYKSDWQIPL